MNLLARALCSSAILLSGTLLLCATVLTVNREVAGLTGWLGLGLAVVGLYRCLRVAGMKLYSAESEPADRPQDVQPK
jgi:hypothetical protein